MADQYSVEVRVTGKDFTSELVRPSEIAEFLKAIEDTLRSIIARDNPELGISENDLVIGLNSITQGSLINTFVTPYQKEVTNAIDLTADAVSSENYASLPFESIEALKIIRKFNRKFGTNTEFGYRNGSYKSLLTITPATKIPVHTFILKNSTTFYGSLLRIGGENPPRAWMHFLNGRRFSCRVKNTAIASQMAQQLYQRIAVKGIAQWDVRDMSLHDFTIEQLLPYKQIGLAKAMNNLSEIAGEYYGGEDSDQLIQDIRGNDEGH